MKRLLGLLFILITIASIKTIPCSAAEINIDWSEDEIEFIDKHPVIRIGVDPGFAPFEFIDIDDEYKGIAADYISLISEKTGIRFEVAKGLTHGRKHITWLFQAI
jgi:hypothetical protein